MVEQEPWTIGRLLQWTADYLKQHGADSPRLDAEVLLAHVRRCTRIQLYTCFTEVADDATRAAYRELVRRRALGEPVAYLVGHREFYSREFLVTPDVLIPRPETEFVVIGMLDLIKASERQREPLLIADVGTGSGILAICAALHLPEARIVAVDLSDKALAVARQNAARHGVAERIEFRTSDLLASVADDQQFDLILSNPPYVATRERPELPRDVVDHEPAMALFAGEDGLDVFRRLIPEAAHRLLPGGWLLAEHAPHQRVALQNLVAATPGLAAPTFLDDLAKHPRVLRTQRSAE